MPALTEERPAIDARAFRKICGRLPTTVVVAGGMHQDKPVGMVVGTFTTVSLDPLLVGYFAMSNSATFGVLNQLESHSFSVLAQHDADTVDSFSRPLDERFDGLSWTVSEYGTPVLDSALMTFHTRPHAVTPAGDHHLVLSEVLGVAVPAEAGRPLLFADGRMTGLVDAGRSVPDGWTLYRTW